MEIAILLVTNLREILAVVITQFQGQTQEAATSKISVLGLEWTFFVFCLFTTIVKRSFVNVAGFLDPSVDCDDFVF